MKGIKAKLLAGLLSVFACFCLGVGIAVNVPADASVTASAATTYTITELAGLGSSSATVINAYPTTEAEKPTVNSWDYAFTFVAETGDGFLFNGEAYEGWTLKQPGDFYIELNRTAVAGDVLTLDGTFYNETAEAYIVFDNCSLRYNGSAWQTYYDIGQLDLHNNGGNQTHLYLKREKGDLPILDWDHAFTYVSGNGFTVGDSATSTLSEMKSTPDGMYLGFSGVTDASTTATFGGIYTYQHPTNGVTYVYNIVDSIFIWNGSSWTNGEDYLGEYTVDAIKPEGGNATSVYIIPEDGDGTSFGKGNWDDVYGFVSDSGRGLYLNGTKLGTTDIKQPGSFFINLGATAEAGHILYIDGDYYSAATDKKITFNDCYLQFNGSSWVTYTPVTHNIGALVLGDHSLNGTGGAGQLYLKRADDGAFPVQVWSNPFILESGDGLKVNDVSKSISEAQSPDGYFWLMFDKVQTGDTVSISGIFYCPTQGVRYTIEESKFTWNGSAWEAYVAPIVYTTHNIGKVETLEGSTGLYISVSNRDAEPVSDWEAPFSYESGNGITVNGTMVGMTNNFKSIGDKLYVTLMDDSENVFSLTVGTELCIGGTFYNKKHAVKYVIEESRFTWNGTAWEPEYEICELGKVVAIEGSTGIYMSFANGITLPVDSWDFAFDYVSGNGITVNGTMINMTNNLKSVGNKLYCGLSTGDDAQLVIEGTFKSVDKAVKYVIEESRFTWNGTAWEAIKDTSAYTVHNIGALEMHVNTKVGSASAMNDVLYLQRADEGTLPVLSWAGADVFTYEEGTGFLVNSTSKTPTKILSTGDGFYWEFGALNVGDVVTIGGTYVCHNQEIKYVIEESKFVWCGYFWDSGNEYAYETYEIGKVYATNEAGTSAGAIHLAAWEGGTFTKADNWTEGDWESVYTFASNSGVGVTLAGTPIAMEDIKLPNNLYVGLQAEANVGDVVVIDGVFYNRDLKVIYIIEESILIWDGNVWTSVESSDTVIISYTTEFGTFKDYTEKNSEYTLLSGRTYDTFIGWVANGVVYQAGDEIGVGEEGLSFTALSLEFFLDEGAAIRLATTADESGIRFTTYIKEDQLNALRSTYGITVSYGTLILPLDYLGAGQQPNLKDFVANETIIKIPSTYQETEDGYVVYRGAMQKLNEGNYERAFAGRGYMEITFDEKTWTVYTPFNLEDNVRSIRYVAQEFQKDTAEYNKVSTQKQEVVDAYAAIDSIDLMNYESYAANNFLNLIAWYYPELDPSNNYDNETNRAIAQKMLDAGIKAVYLDGEYHLDLDSAPNIEKTRQIIHFFWSQGLYTIAFGSNASSNKHIDYATEAYPDFSDCEGFIGYLVWDEPSGTESMESLADFANNFEIIYAGTGVTFMTNLLPSYAGMFNGTTNFWESSIDKLDKDAYKAYLQEYCGTVLSQLDGGERWLSLDSYPIHADGSLTAHFLFDLAMLKYYAETNDAHSHIVLQSSGWEEGSSTQTAMPTEAELRMQAYTAMAFGIDSISWWAYGDMRFEDGEDISENPTDSDDYYNRFATVNNELAKISHIYSAFEWQGVILGTGKNNGNWIVKDNDYLALNAVTGQIGDYELSVSDTKHLSAISTNKTNLNYLMGVMQDMNGNEGYVISNYNNRKAGDMAQTLTLTFDSNVTQVIIYRGGVATTQAVSNKTLTISLATGEGVIVLPSKLG